MRNHRRAFFSCALLLVLACATAGTMFAQHSAGQEKKRALVAVAKMVDKIANSNPAPRIIEGEASDRIALFSASYKWKEQSRVLRALGDLRKDTSDELWEELVRRREDPKYSLTVMDNGGYPWNRTVGDFCRELADDRLKVVFQRHLPTSDEGRMIFLDNDPAVDLAKWRKERKEKSLYQLQIEYCEQMLIQLPKSTKLSADQKETVRKNVEEEIDKLKKTRKPFIPRTGPVGEKVDLFSAEDAKRFREMVKEKSKK